MCYQSGRTEGNSRGTSHTQTGFVHGRQIFPHGGRAPAWAVASHPCPTQLHPQHWALDTHPRRCATRVGEQKATAEAHPTPKQDLCMGARFSPMGGGRQHGLLHHTHAPPSYTHNIGPLIHTLGDVLPEWANRRQQQRHIPHPNRICAWAPDFPPWGEGASMGCCITPMPHPATPTTLGP